jgi:hypothetical protein
MPNWSDDAGNCYFMVGEIPCYQSPDKCPMHGGSTAKRPKTKTTTELNRLRCENADMARALDEAIKIQKKAVSDAYRRGAEVMQESVAQWAVQFCTPGTAVAIRGLSIPEDK